MPSEIVGADLPISYIPDHPARMVRRFLFQDRSKPRIAALAGALGEGSQLHEDQSMDLLTGRLLHLSTGIQLDRWGAIVGETRGILGDTDYRRFIQARILVNICKGTSDEIIAIWKLVMDSNLVRLTLPGAPAFFSLAAIRSEWLTEGLRRRVRRIMADCKPAGVAMELIEALPGPFGFDDTFLPVEGFDVGVLAREV